ncbi:hypothetical protein AQ476_20220 [Burkholderia thailandensis]|nr:hypothetical protein AQ476_20220 [Burkholderia thailandensis]
MPPCIVHRMPHAFASSVPSCAVCAAARASRPLRPIGALDCALASLARRRKRRPMRASGRIATRARPRMPPPAAPASRET